LRYREEFNDEIFLFRKKEDEKNRVNLGILGQEWCGGRRFGDFGSWREF